MCLAKPWLEFDQTTFDLKCEALSDGQLEEDFYEGMNWFLGKKIKEMKTVFTLPMVEQTYRSKVNSNIDKHLSLYL